MKLQLGIYHDFTFSFKPVKKHLEYSDKPYTFIAKQVAMCYNPNKYTTVTQNSLRVSWQCCCKAE